MCKSRVPIGSPQIVVPVVGELLLAGGGVGLGVLGVGARGVHQVEHLVTVQLVQQHHPATGHNIQPRFI